MPFKTAKLVRQSFNESGNHIFPPKADHPLAEILLAMSVVEVEEENFNHGIK